MFRIKGLKVRDKIIDHEKCQVYIIKHESEKIAK